MRTHTKFVMFVVLGVCVGTAVWFGFLDKVTRASQGPDKPFLTKVPPITSCVEHVKLVKAELVTQGDSQVAELELENTAYIGVTSVSVEMSADKDRSAVVRSAFTPDKEPLIVIEPGEKTTISVGNLSKNSRIRIAGAMFSDGSEEGCEKSLEMVRKLKDRDTRKGGPQK